MGNTTRYKEVAGAIVGTTAVIALKEASPILAAFVAGAATVAIAEYIRIKNIERKRNKASLPPQPKDSGIREVTL